MSFPSGTPLTSLRKGGTPISSCTCARCSCWEPLAKPISYEWRSNEIHGYRFEAAWSADLEKIKSLALYAWGEDGTEPPLQIAVQDGASNSPFSLAFFRGHYNVSRAIVEIAHAQYSSPDEDKKLYQLDVGGDCSDPESCSDSDRDDEPRIVSKTVNKTFTIDNVGEVSRQVKSPHKPLDFLHWPCRTFEVKDGVPDPETCRVQSPWDFIINSGRDSRAFRHYLDMCKSSPLQHVSFPLDLVLTALGVHFGGKKGRETVRDDDTSYAPSEGHFRAMIERGSVKMLKEVTARQALEFPWITS